MEELKFCGYTIRIEQDPSPENNPRDMDHLGLMVCLHGKYQLGDYNSELVKSLSSRDLVEDYLAKNEAYWLPLYLLDHSGLSLSTKPFNDVWDSGQVGVIFVTKQQAKNLLDYEAKTCSDDKFRETVICHLQTEVENYDQYLTGDVHSYTVFDRAGTEIASCSGCFGREYTEMMAKAEIENHINEQPAEVPDLTSEQLSAVKAGCYKYMDASMQHMTLLDYGTLLGPKGKGLDQADLPRTIPHQYGIWVNVTSDPECFEDDLKELQLAGLSDKFIRLYTAARKVDADWIYFDVEGTFFKELLTEEELNELERDNV